MILLIAVALFLLAGFTHSVFEKIIYKWVISKSQICYLQDMMWLAKCLVFVLAPLVSVIIVLIYGSWWQMIIITVWFIPTTWEYVAELWGSRDYVKQIVGDSRRYWNRPKMWTV
jgi:hypothetical protein